MANLFETASTHGEDSLTYVLNSINHPNQFVSDGYMAGIMPQNFAERMSEEEILALAEWLLDPNRER
jgi:hypothetical protein